MYKQCHELPPYGGALKWPELQELTLPELTELSSQITCQPPKKQTKVGFANKIINRLQEHFDKEYKPSAHPTDVCGACGGSMPWRPPDEPASHTCAECGKSLHPRIGHDECTRVVTFVDEVPIYYCSKNCEKKKNTTRKRQR